MAATARFAAFTADRDFVNAHENPLPNAYTGTGESIAFDTPDGQKGSAYFIKAESSSDNYLFVIHEWWGLNGHIKEEADNLYAAFDKNINVMALDLYDGKIADNREDAGKYMQAVKTERAEAIVKGALAKAGPDARIFTIGWCFGGGWSLQSSLLAGKQAAGCVIYYGMPEKNVEKLKTLETDVLGIFAGKEQWISPQVVSEFEENMRKAGKKLIVRSFDAEHAFANPSNPGFDPEATAEAMALTLAFINSQL